MTEATYEFDASACLARLGVIRGKCIDLNDSEPEKTRKEINKLVDKLRSDFAEFDQSWYSELSKARKAANDDVMTHIIEAQRLIRKGSSVDLRKDKV